MEQKFRKLTFVKVADKLPSYMSHFDSGFIGIVDGTYSQLYHGPDIKNYCVYKIENNKVVNKIAWYDESHLTALEEQDTLRAEQMIEDYNFGR